MTRALDRPAGREASPQFIDSDGGASAERLIVAAGMPVPHQRDSRVRMWAVRHHLMPSGEPPDHHARNAKAAHRYSFLEDNAMARAMDHL